MRIIPRDCVSAVDGDGAEIFGYCMKRLVWDRKQGANRRYVLVSPRMLAKNSEVIFSGEKILYKCSFCKVLGLTIVRKVLILKKPIDPAPCCGSAGTSSGGRVVRIVVGTSASGARLK